MKIVTEKVVDASVDAVWDLLGERFGDIGQWASAVRASHVDGELGTGAVRTCDLNPTPAASGTITERLTRFDRAQHALTYEVISGMPGFVRFAENAWSVQSAGPGKSRVRSVVTLRVAWWMTPMAPMMRMQFGKVVRGLVGEIEANAGSTLGAMPRPRVEQAVPVG